MRTLRAQILVLAASLKKEKTVVIFQYENRKDRTEKTQFNHMSPKKLYLLILILPILPLCKMQSADATGMVVADSIPEGAVPFEYDFNMKKTIFIPGTLNDSIRLKYLFETGSLKMRFSDTLASNFERKEVRNGLSRVRKTMKVRIGDWELAYSDSVEAVYLDKNNNLFGFAGANVAMMPWQFFDKKIIEISFSKQYIRELSGTEDLHDYDLIKMKVVNGFLGIPVVVSVQKKKIRAFVTIDTGSNAGISFSNGIVSKFGIKSDGAFFEKALRSDGIQKSFAIKSDSIQVGKFFLTEKNQKGKNFVSFAMAKQRDYPFAGLLGTGILEHFDIVMDFKKYCLYLKPFNR